MRKGGQKAKGNAHQRAVAAIFAGAYYPNGGGIFKSTPSKGGWESRAVPGDVIPFREIDPTGAAISGAAMTIDLRFPFSIECKDWKDENVKHFVSGLYSAECQFFDWMEQSQSDASCVGKMPIVIFKLYRTKNMAMLSSQDFREIANSFGNFVGKMYVLERIMPMNEAAASQKLVFVLLSDFIEWIDWHIYKEEE